jgi:tetratricopeptide (TPR) repeat protein
VAFEVLAYQVLGQSSIGHHALSVLLHVAVTAAVALWLESLGAPVRLRISAALVFGLLAIHAEAIAVVSYREDLLAALFGLLAMIAATRGVEAEGRRRASWLGAATLAAAFAAGAKLSAAPIPLLWLLAHRLAPWRQQRLPWLGFAALSLGVALVLAHNVALLGDLSPYEEASGRVHAHRVGWLPVWAASIQIHLAYLQQLAFPRGLSPEYIDFGARFTDGATLCGAGAFALLLGTAIGSARGRRRPLVALAILGSLLLALPTSNLAPMPNMRADRFMYLPSVPASVGLAAILLAAGDALARRFTALLAGLVPLLAFAVVQGAMAQGAATVYRSDTRLWEIATRLAPGSARAHAVYGELLVNRLRARETPDEPQLLLRARTHCALAVRLDPRADLPHLCAARLAAAQRDWSAAHAAFERGLERTGVRRDRALIALASTALDLPDLPYPERVDRAFAHLERATREYPFVGEVFAVDGRIRHRLGRPDQARSSYRRARKLHPERWDVVLAGLELELDLGHSSAAWRPWAREQLEHPAADPVTTDAFRRRLEDARRLFDP